MNTKSEKLFQAFLSSNKINFSRIAEVNEKGERRPDYFIEIDETRVATKRLRWTKHQAGLAKSFDKLSIDQKNKFSTEQNKALLQSFLSTTA